MNDDDKTQEILKLFQYYRADTLKNEQTQLTKTANKVKDIASGRFRVLFSTKELEALYEAATLLSSLKNRVEHAKEIAMREEARRQEALANCQKEARIAINAVFPKKEGNEQELFVWALLLKNYMVSHYGRISDHRASSSWFMIESPDAVADTLQLWFDEADEWETKPPEKKDLSRRQKFISVDVFLNELRYRITDVLEDMLNNYTPGFTERLHAFCQKTEAERAAILDEQTAYLEHFKKRIEISRASHRFIQSVKSVAERD